MASTKMAIYGLSTLLIRRKAEKSPLAARTQNKNDRTKMCLSPAKTKNNNKIEISQKQRMRPKAGRRNYILFAPVLCVCVLLCCCRTRTLVPHLVDARCFRAVLCCKSCWRCLFVTYLSRAGARCPFAFQAYRC